MIKFAWHSPNLILKTQWYFECSFFYQLMIKKKTNSKTENAKLLTHMQNTLM